MYKKVEEVVAGDVVLPAGLPVRGVREYPNQLGVDTFALVLEDTDGQFIVQSQTANTVVEVEDSDTEKK